MIGRLKALFQSIALFAFFFLVFYEVSDRNSLLVCLQHLIGLFQECFNRLHFID